MSSSCVSDAQVNSAAQQLGISPAIVRAQLDAEGGCGATSSAGAQGPAQFLPSTWAGLGCQGNPFDPAAAMACYVIYMKQLLAQFKGSIRSALAAYNAGPGNIQAGMGYADGILAAAGSGRSAVSTGVSISSATASTASANATNDPACAWGIGGQSVGFAFIHFGLPSACVIRKTEVRALLGGLTLVAAASVGLVGTLILAAAGLRGPAAAAAGRALNAVPAGKMARRASRGTQKAPRPRPEPRARMTPEQRQAQAQARRAAGPAAQQARARRGYAPRRPRPAPAPKPPPEVHHE